MSTQTLATLDHAWFETKNNTLHFDGVDLEKLAEKVGTPCYVYSLRAIENAYKNIDQALMSLPHWVAYAAKANGNLAILKHLAGLGCGADIVSGGELELVLAAGFKPERIVYSGVGKRDEELAFAAKTGIASIHIEAKEELGVLRHLGTKQKPVSVSIRYNPDVDPQTHPYIATGLRESKFGFDEKTSLELIAEVLKIKTLQLVGVAMHIGSQLGASAPLEEAAEKLGRFAARCTELGAKLRILDVGGGWPMHYGNEKKPYPPVQDFGAAIQRGLKKSGFDLSGVTIVTEPGRALVGDAGILLTRVLAIKDQGGKRFCIVDAAMNDLIRPALYGAYHAILPVKQSAQTATQRVDVVGPVCESGDFLGKDRDLPASLNRNDLLIVRGAGAYGREMASNYNARVAAAEITVENGKAHLVRPRPEAHSLWAIESDKPISI